MDSLQEFARAAGTVLREIINRAVSVQPAPPSEVILVIAAIAALAVLLRPVWPATRLLITITHEGAHGVAALLTGRRLHGIRLHSDTSGVTLSSGRPDGPGMIIMLAAGYLGPAVVGIGAALLLAAGRSVGLLWLLLILLALLLVQIRNFYGLLVILGVGAGLVAISWYAPPTVQSGVAYLITWILLIAAPKPVIELIRHRNHPQTAGSDAAQLAGLTRLPALAWSLLFLVANVAGLVLGISFLLPGLIQRLMALAG
ncbi:M50 family metallopeptidase [Microlunatus parietis]|uniref:Peptidase M50B-like n=1 Tax=Microlunatus parietis TaxID=682979 RepID=A0A7Y9LD62_9ACTN|nr:M50 family metallopeptidase [Microlunatus parietis]NYE72568.1 hypothetical protein [Microlunatus parietis]